MTRRTLAGVTALTIVLSAGTVTAQVRSAPSEQRQPQRDRVSTQSTERTAQTELRLHKADDLIGSDLHNRNGDKVGSIEDFIVERGSGRLVFAIVEIGGVLGIGGTEFALPYEQLSWSDTDDRFLTDMTREAAEARGEFLPENWNDLHHVTWMDRMTGWYGSDHDDDATEQAIMAATGRARSEEIRGRVIDVRRHDDRTDSDTVIVEIETENGDRREVILGPSWYVTGHEAVPLRGQTIVIHARQHEGRHYGWSAGQRGNEMMLRNEEGRSAWHKERGSDRADTPATENRDRTGAGRDRPADRTATREGTDRSPASTAADAPTRYILLSGLIGADANARGISSGEIEGALIERRSGKVAFLLFDPNENFLGIGDTISMVPWSIAYINSDMKVNFDADASAFRNAMEVPDDVQTLRSAAAVEPAYRAFQVRPAQFRERDLSRPQTRHDTSRDARDPSQDRRERTGTADRPATNPDRRP